MPRGIHNSAESSNPFRYGALALDEAFADRERELRELVSDVRNGQDVVIFAPRRYGKSSLVWRAMSRLSPRTALVAHVDLMTTPTKHKLAEKLADSIYDNVASVLERARERALAPFRSLLVQPTVTIDPVDGRLRFTFELGRQPADIDTTLERLFALPGELGAGRGRSVALVLDEFQEVVEIDPQLPKLMRSVFQEQPEVAHVYLGSRRHVMERIFNDENEPFWRSAKSVELGPIDPGSFADHIGERFAATGKRIGAEVVAELLERTGGHPYATQELAYFLWEQTPAGDETGEQESAAALAAVVRAEHAHFSLVWERAPRTQRLLLEALAAEQPGRPLSSDYRRRHDLPSASSVQKAARALVDRELIANDRGSYWISEPFLAEWIEANISD
jgi:uncharacterized protein